jgi:hypothetical protein
VPQRAANSTLAPVPGDDLPFERSSERREPVLHPLPQPKLPDKNGLPPPAIDPAIDKAPEQRA